MHHCDKKKDSQRKLGLKNVHYHCEDNLNSQSSSRRRMFENEKNLVAAHVLTAKEKLEKIKKQAGGRFMSPMEKRRISLNQKSVNSSSLLSLLGYGSVTPDKPVNQQQTSDLKTKLPIAPKPPKVVRKEEVQSGASTPSTNLGTSATPSPMLSKRGQTP